MKRTALPLIKDCNDCGQCCHGQEALPVSWYLAPLHPQGDPAILPPELRRELECMLAFFKLHGFPVGTPCVWFDAEKKQCKHYEHRPELCKTELMPGDETCRRIRQKAGMDGAKKYRVVGGRLRVVSEKE
jgi:Fe-S-cluster containining protein